MKLTIFSLFISLIVFRFIRNRRTQNRTKGKVYVKPILPIQFWLYITLVLLTMVEFFIAKRGMDLFITGSGVFLYILGLIGREWAIKTLGSLWSADIRIQENHHIVKDGPYRYVRHPNLLCLLLEVNGLCLILNSYFSLIFVWIVYFPLILIRINLEERVLLKEFGDDYKNYKKEVSSLLPIRRIRCILKQGS